MSSSRLSALAPYASSVRLDNGNVGGDRVLFEGEGEDDALTVASSISFATDDGSYSDRDVVVEDVAFDVDGRQVGIRRFRAFNVTGVTFDIDCPGSQAFLDSLNCDMHYPHRFDVLDTVRNVLASYLYEEDRSLFDFRGSVVFPVPPCVGSYEDIFVSPYIRYGLYEIGFYNMDVGCRIGNCEVSFPVRSVICPLCGVRRVNFASLVCLGCCLDDVKKPNNRFYFNRYVLGGDVVGVVGSGYLGSLPEEVFDLVVDYVVDIGKRPCHMYLNRAYVGRRVASNFTAIHGPVFGVPVTVSFPVKSGRSYESLWWMEREESSVYSGMQCGNGVEPYDVEVIDPLDDSLV